MAFPHRCVGVDAAPSTSSSLPPLLGTKRTTEEPPAAAEKAHAVVQDLAEASKAEKKEIAVDHKLVMAEVQLLLAEKRTSFALMRTGVTVALLPLSVWTVLIATSALWNIWDSWWMLAPVMLVSVLLFGLGTYLIGHALNHLAHTDRVIMGLRQSDTLLEDLLVEHGRASRVIKPWTWRHTH